MINSSVLIQRHFHNNRALGGGLGMVGYSLGHLVGPQLVALLIRLYGWRGAHLISSALFANIIALGATFWLPEERYKKENINEIGDIIEGDEESIGSNSNAGNFQNLETSKHASTSEEFPGMPTYNECRDDSVAKSDSEVSSSESEETDLADQKGKNNTPVSSGVKDFCKDIFDLSYLKDAKFTLMCFCAAIARYNIKTFIELGPSKSVSIGMTRSEAASIISVFSLVAISVRVVSTFVANMKIINRCFYYGVGVLFGAVASLLTLIHTFQGQVGAAVVHGFHTGMSFSLNHLARKGDEEL